MRKEWIWQGIGLERWWWRIELRMHDEIDQGNWIWMMMRWMDRISDGENKSFFLLFLLFLKCFNFFGFWNFYDFFGFLDFMIFLGFLGLRWKIKQGNMYKAKCVSNTQERQTHQQSYKVSTRLYKDQLEGVLDIRKVREAQICRWKKILPHSRGEMVTQISSFTSQRYKVLWGLAKSDNILLPREVSFDWPPNFYTPPEH